MAQRPKEFSQPINGVFLDNNTLHTKTIHSVVKGQKSKFLSFPEPSHNSPHHQTRCITEER